MLVKEHNSYRRIIAICDSDLLGKTFEEGNKQIKINPHFFQGDEKNTQEVENIIERGSYEDATFNIVGKESVETALKIGIIQKEGVKTIQGIPVALILL